MEIEVLKNLSGDLFKEIFFNSEVPIAILDENGKYLLQNKAHENLLGYSLNELKDKTPKIHLGDAFEKVLEDIKNQGFFLGEVISTRKDGKKLHLILNAFPVKVRGKTYYVGLKQDISHIKSNTKFMSKVLETAPIGVIIFDEKVVFVNEYGKELLQIDELAEAYFKDLFNEPYKEFAELLVKKLKENKLKRTSLILSIRNIDKEIWVYGTFDVVDYFGEKKGIFTFVDITKQKSLEDKIYKLENFDLLTNLPNRYLFKQELEVLLSEIDSDECLGVFLIDIYNFTDINDTYGSKTGDTLLKEFAKRLKECFPEGSLIARYGSDEFIVAVKQKRKEDKACASNLLVEVKNCLKRPFKVGDREFNLDFNMGMAFYPYDGKTPQVLTANAELALKEAKRKGIGEFSIFNLEVDKNFREKLILINQLKEAIKNKDFDVYFQPKVDLTTGEVVGAEALARWKVPPNEFIPALVEANLMFDAGCMITEKALKYTKELLKIKPDLKISVNMSFEQLKFDECPSKLLGLTCQNEVSPENIIVEITETETMRDPDKHLPRLEHLKKLGYELSIDDFGTGYSSLNYLKLIPASEIKIDRSFVRDIFTDESDAKLVELIIEIGKILGMKVVAEGIETKEQAKLLKSLGCHYGQGYFFAKPMPFEEFKTYLKQQ